MLIKVEMDAVVKEYVENARFAIFPAQRRCLNYPTKASSSKKGVLMSVLRGMVVSGAATHNYDAYRKTDEFHSTERLIRNWSGGSSPETL